MKKVLLLLLICFGFISCDCQRINSFFNTPILNTLIDDCSSLRIIGVGEASHGVGDFHNLRSEFFFTLVDKYQFNTVFLEAGFAECLLINSYIKDANSKYTTKQLLDSLGYYPWQNDELVNLIDEMRRYNLEKGKDFLMFLGVDMQFKNQAIENILSIKGVSGQTIFTDAQISFLKELKELENYDGKKTILTNLNNIKEKIIPMMEGIDFDDWLNKYSIFTLIQYFEMEYDETFKDDGNSVRDISMASNIIGILNAKPRTKGIIIAHNGHISKAIQRKNYKGMGFYLKERYKEKYLALGTEFSTGKFIGANPRLYKKNKGKNFFQEFEVVENKNNSLGNKILDLIPENSSSNYWYISPAELKLKFNDKLNATDLLGIHKKNFKKNYWKIVPSDYYDAVFFFRKVKSSSFYFLDL